MVGVNSKMPSPSFAQKILASLTPAVADAPRRHFPRTLSPPPPPPPPASSSPPASPQLSEGRGGSTTDAGPRDEGSRSSALSRSSRQTSDDSDDDDDDDDASLATAPQKRRQKRRRPHVVVAVRATTVYRVCTANPQDEPGDTWALVRAVWDQSFAVLGEPGAADAARKVGEPRVHVSVSDFVLWDPVNGD